MRSRSSLPWVGRPMPFCTCIAMAAEADVDLTLDDFTRIGARVPVLADVRPSGRYLMAELIAIGGIQPLMKRLLNKGLLHGDCMTVTGKTRGRKPGGRCGLPADQDIVRDFENPIKPDSHLVVLYGNLAPEGAVAKISGKEGLRFEGGRAYSIRRKTHLQAILGQQIVSGDVVVIRYEGPKAGPACARC